MNDRTQKVATWVGIVVAGLAILGAGGWVIVLYVNQAVAAENKDLADTVATIQDEMVLVRDDVGDLTVGLADNTKVVREFDAAFRTYLQRQIELAEERARRAGGG